MLADIVQIAITFFAAMGFALFFNVYRSHVLITSIGATITWCLFKFCSMFMTGYFLPVMVAALFAAFFSEFLSWKTKAPTPVFYVISVIPLIPGRTLFYAMSEAVAANWEQCSSYAIMTLEYAAGIAVGISLVTAVVQTFKLVRRKLKEKLKVSLPAPDKPAK